MTYLAREGVEVLYLCIHIDMMNAWVWVETSRWRRPTGCGEKEGRENESGETSDRKGTDGQEKRERVR